ncbi:HEAT repeat domain-containing protein [Lyngbya confervoides]|uniref:HEAT repeat domain-containing protein n=1 Tax=Lyngbya confervoides BDU141951 TaxID=1574623 RepID=A0ABD4T4Q7_9CYAN|nr:HEAT repeat domain-containing protein [Lyngbya confervoides]MCM1983483.1 HEAT repeat domain-containing protein [Lyngbya confervoides BDU141951]
MPTSMIESLSHGDFNARWTAMKELKRSVDEVLPQLIDLLRQCPEDFELQIFIAQILGESQHPDAILALVTLLHESSNEEVQDVVALSLSQLGVAAIEILMQGRSQPALHLPIVRGLAQLSHPDTIPALREFCHQPQPQVRAVALEALGRFHSPEVTDLLIQAISDLDPQVRSVAVQALGLRMESEISLPLLDALIPCLYDLNVAVVIQAIQALGRFHQFRAIASLWDRYRVEPHPTRLTLPLIQALGWSKTESGIAHLLEILAAARGEDPPQLQQEARPYPVEQVEVLVQTLSQMNDTPQAAAVVQGLVRALHSSQAPWDQIQVKKSLVMAIAQFQQPMAIAPLIHCLAIADDGLRFHIVAALKHIDPPRSQRALQELAESRNPELRTGIAMALREW